MSKLVISSRINYHIILILFIIIIIMIYYNYHNSKTTIEKFNNTFTNNINIDSSDFFKHTGYNFTNQNIDIPNDLFDKIQYIKHPRSFKEFSDIVYLGNNL
jgi:hypothetical protein